ncbi:MAG: 30S ribosomal protein S16 [Sumerlaeia bacterium]
MVRIRLTRIGRKKAPFYRLVVQDSRRARDGRFIEIIGRYQPVNPNPEKEVEIFEERALYWLHNGAQPTDTVRGLLKKSGILDKYTTEKQDRKKALTTE